MAVRIKNQTTVYYTPACQIIDLAEGQIVDGDLGVWLKAAIPGQVEEATTTEAPDPPVEGPAASDTGSDTGAAEVGTEAAPAPEPEAQQQGPAVPAGDSPDDPPAAYDPSTHTVAQVLAYVKDNPDQASAVLAAEQVGRKRTTILSELAA